MRARILAAVFLASVTVMTMIGCSANWDYKPLAEFATAGAQPAASVCSGCHESEHKTWTDTKHSRADNMATVTVDQFKECGACHTGIEDHAANMDAPKPPSIAGMTKTEQNELCGKCHYNKDVMGNDAINPYAKHAPIMSVGFDEEKKRQISCLECHSGHQGKSEMLQNIKAHVCFKCHKEAIITMGLFQPFNYAAFGKACQLCHAVHGGTTGQLAGRMAIGIATCVPCHI